MTTDLLIASTDSKLLDILMLLSAFFGPSSPLIGSLHAYLQAPSVVLAVSWTDVEQSCFPSLASVFAMFCLLITGG
jgi:hypothetical protein